MAKRKQSQKREAKPKPRSPLDQTAVLLLAEAAQEIKAQDCAAFCLVTFGKGDIPPEWEAAIPEALRKFLTFGWTAFHSLGGLNTDWNKAASRLRATVAAKPEAAR